MPSIEIVPVGEYQMNCYLVENEKTRELFIVDAGGDGQKIIQAVGSRKPVAVLATHGHYDHIGGVDEVCGHFGIPFYLHQMDLPKLSSARLNCSQQFDRSMTIATQGVPLTEGQKLRLAGMEIAVMHTPGHSAGSCCFLLPEMPCVFCGDTLFHGGYGRTDFEDGSFVELKKSLRRLLFMTPPMAAYPGHGSSTVAGRAEESL